MKWIEASTLLSVRENELSDLLNHIKYFFLNHKIAKIHIPKITFTCTLLTSLSFLVSALKVVQYLFYIDFDLVAQF